MCFSPRLDLGNTLSPRYIYFYLILKSFRHYECCQSLSTPLAFSWLCNQLFLLDPSLAAEIWSCTLAICALHASQMAMRLNLPAIQISLDHWPHDPEYETFGVILSSLAVFIWRGFQKPLDFLSMWSQLSHLYIVFHFTNLASGSRTSQVGLHSKQTHHWRWLTKSNGTINKTRYNTSYHSYSGLVFLPALFSNYYWCKLRWL